MSRWSKDEIQTSEKFSRMGWGSKRFPQSSEVKFGLVLKLGIERPCERVEIKLE